MKYGKYVKPELEEMELILEGSFLESNSVGIEKGTTLTEGDEDSWD